MPDIARLRNTFTKDFTFISIDFPSSLPDYQIICLSIRNIPVVVIVNGAKLWPKVWVTIDPTPRDNLSHLVNFLHNFALTTPPKNF